MISGKIVGGIITAIIGAVFGGAAYSTGWKAGDRDAANQRGAENASNDGFSDQPEEENFFFQNEIEAEETEATETTE